MGGMGQAVKKESPAFIVRLRFLTGVGLLATVVLWARLAWLQCIRFSDFQTLAKRQQWAPKKLQPPRGFLFDRSGELLAMNVDLYDVYAHPQRVRNRDKTARELAAVLTQPYEEILRKLNQKEPFVWIERRVSYEKSKRLENLRLEGIGLTLRSTRFYPHRSLAAQVIGFTGIDQQGLEGLEKALNEELQGRPGLVFAERDAKGNLLVEQRTARAPLRGLNAVSTLDKTIQHVVEVELEKAFRKYRCRSAQAVVLDPKTGDILALANYPTFDPNHYADYPRETWRNRVIQDQMEPGSTFKLIAAAAALEEGLAQEDDLFFCENGKYVTAEGRTISDHEKHGWLTFREVFGYSSNIGMVKIGQKIGANLLYRYAERFGFGRKTGILFPGEAEGLLRPLDQWSALSLSSIPYGYEVAATPLQVVSAYAAIANEGIRMQPRLLLRLEDPEGKVVRRFEPKEIGRVCSKKTAQRLKELLTWAVEKGTGKAVALPTYAIAGKTGTAHKLIGGRYSPYNYVSSFVGFVPAEDPRFVLLVVLDDPRGLYWGGYTAGPVFKEVTKRILAYQAVPPREEKLARKEKKGTQAPALIGLTLMQAKQVARRSGWTLKWKGEGSRVVQQIPPPSSRSIEGGGRVLQVHLGKTIAVSKAGRMPDVRGKTKRQALALLAPLGLQVQFEGSGRIRTQFPQPGREVQPGEACRLSCETQRAGQPLLQENAS